MRNTILSRIAALTLFVVVVGAMFAYPPTPARAQNKPIPSGGTLLLPADKTLAAFGKIGGVEVTTVPVSGQPFNEALRVAIKTRPNDPWNIQLRAPSQAAVKKGDVLLATFYARSISGGQVESGQGEIGFVFELDRAPHTKSADYNVAVPRTWTRYDVPFDADVDLKAGEAAINFRLGFAPQVLEIGGVRVVNYGSTVKKQDLPTLQLTYRGREANAAWRKAALARIEKIRKGNLNVLVTDAAGKAVRGASVSVTMTRHHFPFGSAVAADGIADKSENGTKYREIIEKYFNRVVMENDLKMPGWEENRQRALNGVAWLREKKIEVRGHNLVWPSKQWLPDDVDVLIDKKDKPALANRINNHIKDIVTANKGQLIEWDVVNEPFANHQVMDVLDGSNNGGNVMAGWFRLARQYDDKPILFLNDYPPLDGSAADNRHLRNFYENIAFLKKSGAPMGGIGFQCHIGSSVIPPANLVSGLDRFAVFNLPIAITEFDINTDDDELQAAYMRDFLIATFSHPSVNSVIMWGFWEGRHWIPKAALWRKDWSIKPAGQAWIDTVFGEWRTVANGKTNAQGKMTTRAFYGDYEVVVTLPGGETTTATVLLRPGTTGVTTIQMATPRK